MDKQLIARVRKMEEDFNLIREVIDTLDGALYDYEAVQRRIKRLSDYQESGQWLKDFEADEKGELPKDMEKGVLSEDGLDSLLSDIASVHARMDSLVNEPDDEEEAAPYMVEFDPLCDSPDSIPEEAGAMIVTLRYMSSCPGFWNYDPKEFEGLDVLFVGESENLRRRITRNHLSGNSGLSSFRYSLGILHGMHSFTTDGGKHWHFPPEDERWLSQWMKENLIFYYTVTPLKDVVATMLVKMYDPALNLENDSKATEDFRRKLIALRANHIEEADFEHVKTKATTIRLPNEGKDLESALTEALADNAARIPDKLGIASVRTDISCNGNDDTLVAMVFGHLNDYGEKEQQFTLMAYNFEDPQKMKAFLKSPEKKYLDGDEDSETFELTTKAGNRNLPAFVATVLKKHLGITENSKLVLKTTAHLHR